MKNRKLRKSKNQDFSKGVSPWFWSKIRNFSMFLFLARSTEQNVFDVILESQKSFLDYEKQKVKKVKKSGFFQRG